MRQRSRRAKHKIPVFLATVFKQKIDNEDVINGLLEEIEILSHAKLTCM
jgi:hypothetical protein